MRINVIVNILFSIVYIALGHQLWLNYLENVPEVWSGAILYTVFYGLALFISTLFYFILFLMIKIMIEGINNDT